MTDGVYIFGYFLCFLSEYEIRVGIER